MHLLYANDDLVSRFVEALARSLQKCNFSLANLELNR